MPPFRSEDAPIADIPADDAIEFAGNVDAPGMLSWSSFRMRPNVKLALVQGEPIQVADLREDAPSAANDIVLRAGYRARLLAPLSRGEEIVGMLVVRRRTPGAFPEKTVDLIKTPQQSAEQQAALERVNAYNHARCVGYGWPPEAPEYNQCRQLLVEMRGGGPEGMLADTTLHLMAIP